MLICSWGRDGGGRGGVVGWGLWAGFCGLIGWESSGLGRVEKFNFVFLFFARGFNNRAFINNANTQFKSQKETHATFPSVI